MSKTARIDQEPSRAALRDMHTSLFKLQERVEMMQGRLDRAGIAVEAALEDPGVFLRSPVALKNIERAVRDVTEVCDHLVGHMGMIHSIVKENGMHPGPSGLFRTAKANVEPVRQRTQYSCMAASMTMCLKALGYTQLDEDQVNQVMGAQPMKGAAWEQALACAQHYGCRATLTMPATVEQLKRWTDAGVPVMIAWNPEGRPWSHASVVFDVDADLNVYIADPNIPNPKETVRVVSEDEFYGKWYEQFPNYLVRRPACAIEREITMNGTQVRLASSAKTAEAGRYTGTTWAELKKWLSDAKNVPPVEVTPTRAQKILQDARSFGSTLPPLMTQGETRYVNDVWETRPGNTSFNDALVFIARGGVPRKASERMHSKYNEGQPTTSQNRMASVNHEAARAGLRVDGFQFKWKQASGEFTRGHGRTTKALRTWSLINDQSERHMIAMLTHTHTDPIYAHGEPVWRVHVRVFANADEVARLGTFNTLTIKKSFPSPTGVENLDEAMDFAERMFIKYNEGRPTTSQNRMASEPGWTWDDRERSPKGVPYPKSVWDNVGFRVFDWATPARVIEGGYPEPWRVTDTQGALDLLKHMFPAFAPDLYTSTGDKYRGREQIVVSWRGRPNTPSRAEVLATVSEGLKAKRLPHQYDPAKSAFLFLSDDLARDVLRRASDIEAKKRPQNAPKTQEERDQEQVTQHGTLPAPRNQVVRDLINHGSRGRGVHKNPRDFDRGHARGMEASVIERLVEAAENHDGFQICTAQWKANTPEESERVEHLARRFAASMRGGQ